MSKYELDLFLKHLVEFANHFRRNPHSLLAKIYGVFTVKMEGAGVVHVLMMENTLRIENRMRIKHIFDVKGSTV